MMARMDRPPDPHGCSKLQSSAFSLGSRLARTQGSALRSEVPGEHQEHRGALRGPPPITTLMRARSVPGALAPQCWQQRGSAKTCA